MPKQVTTVNMERMRERAQDMGRTTSTDWRETCNEPSDGADIETAAAVPKILFVSCTPIEARPSTGVDQRLKLLFDAFNEMGHVTFYQPALAGCRPFRRNRPLGSLRDQATTRAVLHPDLRWHRWRTAVSFEFKKLEPDQFDIVFLHRLGASWYTGWTDSRRTIVDIDDVPSKTYEDRMRYGLSLKRLPRQLLLRWMRRCERRVLDSFRFGLVCSEEDRRYLDHPNAAVVPNAFFVPHAQQIPQRQEGAGSLLFVGSLGYPPNPEGLAWFVREVLPLIRFDVPGVSLTVVGREPSRGTAHFAWKDEPGVRFLGAVESVSPHIHESKLEVCPLLRGQGTRIKIIESLAHGKPVVSTTVGAFGLDATDSQGLFRRDDAKAFAATCVQLLRDRRLRATLGESGRQWVLRYASPDAMKRHLNRVIQTILQESGGTR